jgi:hypothetical protein
MPKYRINYTIERWYRIDVEAEDQAEARRLFWEDEIDYQTNPPKDLGEMVSDYIYVEEVANERLHDNAGL